MIYELKVTLNSVDVPVWRDIQIDSRATFYDLHEAIQAAFEWEGYHLHEFMPMKVDSRKVKQFKIKPVNDEADIIPFLPVSENEILDEDEELLMNWLIQTTDKVKYIYDFGDDWQHDIVLKKILKRDTTKSYPCCTKVRNFAPSEDSRGEVISGEVTLENADTEQLRNEINEKMEFEVNDSFIEEIVNDDWEVVLTYAKEFSRLKPWKTMADEDIFAVVDPVTEETFFCSVLGANEETFGLVAYIGKEGYSVLMDILNGADNTFDILLHQRSIFISFENREDIDQKDYDIIKQYDVNFRGRKAWPAFLSLRPGMEPWHLDNEEVRMMGLVMKEAIYVYHQIADSLELPDIYNKKQVFARVPKNKDVNVFENKFIDLEEYEQEEQEMPPLAVSEIELKRIKKINNMLPTTIEFSMVHLDMPIQNNPAERPMFPLFVVSVEQGSGIVCHQNLLSNNFDVAQMQRELLNMIVTLDAIPKTILMDPKTAFTMGSVINELGLPVEVYHELPFTREMLQELMQNMPDI